MALTTESMGDDRKCECGIHADIVDGRCRRCALPPGDAPEVAEVAEPAADAPAETEPAEPVEAPAE